MPIHRPMWHRTIPKSSIPGLPCPQCATGKLKLIKDGLNVREPRYSTDWREKDWENWEPWQNVERWSAELRCDEGACGEIVNMIGDIESVQTEIELSGGIMTWGFEDALRIQAVYPAPPLFPVSSNVPRPVARELEVTARMFWTDTSACVARLRTAVERLLDDQKVPKEKKTKKGKVLRMDLKERIDAFATGAIHADQLQGLRNIGNLGTHGGSDVTNEDLFDAIDVLEFVMTGIYDTQTINAKAKKLQAKKSGT
jgi:Domain of unknown function (DUF4145)